MKFTPTQTTISSCREAAAMDTSSIPQTKYEVYTSTPARQHLESLLDDKDKDRRDALVKFYVAYQTVAECAPVPDDGCTFTIKTKQPGDRGLTIRIQPADKRIVCWLPTEKKVMIEAGALCPHCRHAVAVKLHTYMAARALAEGTAHDIPVEQYCEWLAENPQAIFGVKVGYDPSRLVADEQNPDFFRTWNN